MNNCYRKVTINLESNVHSNLQLALNLRGLLQIHGQIPHRAKKEKYLSQKSYQNKNVNICIPILDFIMTCRMSWRDKYNESTVSALGSMCLYVACAFSKMLQQLYLGALKGIYNLALSLTIAQIVQGQCMLSL